MKEKSERSFRTLVIGAIAIALIASAVLTSHATDQRGMSYTHEGMKSASRVAERPAIGTEPINYPAVSKMLVAGLTIYPTCDGYIDAAEWSDAYMYDISDTTGQSDGDVDPLGTVFLWLKQDDNGIYFAVRNNADAILDDHDQIGLHFDDNWDGCFGASATSAWLR